MRWTPIVLCLFLVQPLAAHWVYLERDPALDLSGQTILWDHSLEARRGRTLEILANRQITLVVFGLACEAAITLAGDENGLLQFERTTDGKGNRLALTYDSATGRLAEVADHPTPSQARRLIFACHADGKLASVTERYGTQTGRNVQLTYNAENLVLARDQGGRSTAYVYDTAHQQGGLLQHAQRPEGNTPVRQTWDPAARVATQSDAYGNLTTFNYGDPGAPGITRVTDPLNRTTSYRHRDNGSPLDVTDPLERTTRFEVNEQQLPVQITTPAGALRVRDYHPATGARVRQVDENGNEWLLTYTPRAHATGVILQDLAQIDYPDGTRRRFIYDQAGNMLAHVDPAGHSWTYTYTVFGKVLRATNALGGSVTFAYDQFRNPVSRTDSFGNATTYGYDAFKRLDRVTWPDNSSRSVVYDPYNRVASITDERGLTTTRTYDQNGNLIRITDAQSNVTSMAYDLLDRVTRITPPAMAPISVSYDALSRLAGATLPGGNVFNYAYDAGGQLVSVSDSLGLVRSNAYHTDGWLSRVTDDLGNTHSLSHDPAGRIIRIQSGAGRTARFEYDAMNRVQSADFGGLITRWTREARGFPTAISGPGALVDMGYTLDPLGNLAGVTDALGNAWSRNHDGEGRLISWTDPLAATTVFSYDHRHRVAQISFPAGLGDLRFTYDPADDITRLLYSDGTDFRYSYDARSRLTEATEFFQAYHAHGRPTNSNGIILDYDATGRISRVAYADPGHVVAYTYNARNQVTRLADWLGGQMNFEYDRAARVSKVIRPNGIDTHYHYDADGFLIGIEEKKGAQRISAVTLTRDALGQIAGADRVYPTTPPPSGLAAGSQVYQYNPAAQNTAHSYDALGRLVGDGRRTYTWNLASRLIRYTEGDATVDFTYDGLGNRTARRDAIAHEKFVWSHAFFRPAIAMIRDGANANVKRMNVCTPGGELLYSVMADGSRQFFHFDEMGNTACVSNDSGEILACYRYTPFGELLTDSSNGTLPNPFTFQGRYSVMREGALYSFRARYYDPATARFLSRDPIAGVGLQSVNPYQYAALNPLLYADPSAQQSVPVEPPAAARDLLRVEAPSGKSGLTLTLQDADPFWQLAALFSADLALAPISDKAIMAPIDRSDMPDLSPPLELDDLQGSIMSQLAPSVLDSGMFGSLLGSSVPPKVTAVELDEHLNKEIIQIELKFEADSDRRSKGLDPGDPVAFLNNELGKELERFLKAPAALRRIAEFLAEEERRAAPRWTQPRPR